MSDEAANQVQDKSLSVHCLLPSWMPSLQLAHLDDDKSIVGKG